MTYQLTALSTVVRLRDMAIIPVDDENADYQEYLRWVAAGHEPLPFESPVPAPSIEGNRVAIQSALDERARERGYDDIKSGCSYAAPAPVVPADCPEFAICERFRAEGNALQAWMALTWATAFAYIADPDNPVPSAAEAVAMMPPFHWPGEGADVPTSAEPITP